VSLIRTLGALGKPSRKETYGRAQRRDVEMVDDRRCAGVGVVPALFVFRDGSVQASAAAALLPLQF
jgi:hypothetical protein